MSSEGKIQTVKKYGLLYGAFIIYSLVAVCSKIASFQPDLFRTCLFLGLEVVCLGVYALVWQQVLKRFPLVTAMANKGSVVIFNLIWSVILFSEHVTIFNMVGAAIIIFGIWMVSSDG
ncbi:MAG: EamA family transporter [Clostridiales bacterium]|nr:EamA family transporter [Clostridiales bacterium]